MNRKCKLTMVAILCSLSVFAQNKYSYSVNLNEVKDDKVKVTLKAPKITKTSAVFSFPKIIPGTYRIADYGKFIHNVKAVDGQGKELNVKKTSDNTWQIGNANKLATVTYEVEDVWDSETANDIYPMAGTNIEEGKNFVINPPGWFGYFDGVRNIPFELNIQRPDNFYAATPLKPVSNGSTDQFTLDNADHLYDSPIMFSVPDTTTIKLANAEVLIAVYSPKKQVQSKFIAQLLSNLLHATAKYLGGRLPVDKYAFIFYFNSEQRPFKLPGALEHNYSSFYSLPEAPQQNLASMIMDIAAHEFFHIVTPLTISSKEVKEFDFNKAVLSKHLWLYEGSTEYASDHVQVRYGLNTPQQFLDKLAAKIRNSKTVYNDKITFTELSKESAGKHKDQFGNVYEKGALISACLDIYLLHLSNGSYDLTKLKHDLSIKYGAKSYFEDEQLFDIITQMTFPEVRDFFKRYVENNEPIPYEKFFAMAGVKYSIAKVTDTTKKQSDGSFGTKDQYKLEFMPGTGVKEGLVRQAWLTVDGKGIAMTSDRADVAEIDNVIKTLYDVISGDAGQRNWERFRSLFVPTAYMGASVQTQNGSRFVTFTPEEYVRRNDPAFLKESFREKEIGRTVNQFGNVAQVFTTYEFDLGNGKAKHRGINSVQLVKEQGRWWIVSIIWQEENKDLPIPAEYLRQ